MKIYGMLVVCALMAGAVFAGGDKEGEAQPPPPAWMKIPPAPALTAEEALKTFKLQPGFHIEVVASDPLVHDPIAIAFDPDGKIYVVEMRGFMPNADGIGEDQPVGTVTILEDTDGDGKMDKRTEFADKLVLPRALNLSNGGVMIAEPPKLLFCRDKDGDGKADTRGTLANDYGSRGNPEHTANGLMTGLDNWIYSANFDSRFRWKGHQLLREPTTVRGQWGLTQDDWGRMYFNSNSNLLFADSLPAEYLFRNTYYMPSKPELTALGLGVEIVKDQSVYSSRVNPGVNRGYQPKALRPDGRLDKVTATCGPGAYRGDNFPGEYRNNIFIPEPSANLIKREIISEHGIALSGKSAYDKDEFLTSTDERFRPVNTYTGPDGCLYIVDLYRGILQHRIYLTTYLKRQSLERGLDKNIGMGRIYRVIADGKKPGPAPHMSGESSAELVKHLAHPNGWWRDTAQRLLVERGDQSVVPELRKMAATPETAESMMRLHALWTLEGLEALDAATLKAALSDPRPKLQMNAIRLSEQVLRAPAPAAGEAAKPFVPPQELLEALQAVAAKNSDEGVKLQLVLSLSEIAHPIAEKIVENILRTNIDSVAVRTAAITGLGGREVETIKKLCANPDWDQASPGREAFLNALAGCVMKRRVGERVGMLLDLAAAQGTAQSWRAVSLLQGLVRNGPKNGRRVKLAEQPAALTKLLESTDSALKGLAKQADALIRWPNRPGMEPEPPPLEGAHLASFERGKEVYKLCAECHHPQGWGIEGKAPPLADSEWAQGTEERTIRMVLHGMAGPKHIGDSIFNKSGNLEMPAMGGTLNDQQIADVLTYIRRDWENFAPQVALGTVTQIRQKEAGREGPWTEKELTPFGPAVKDAAKKKGK